jgi:hypothetical protein
LSEIESEIESEEKVQCGEEEEEESYEEESYEKIRYCIC